MLTCCEIDIRRPDACWSGRRLRHPVDHSPAGARSGRYGGITDACSRASLRSRRSGVCSVLRRCWTGRAKLAIPRHLASPHDARASNRRKHPDGRVRKGCRGDRSIRTPAPKSAPTSAPARRERREPEPPFRCSVTRRPLSLAAAAAGNPAPLAAPHDTGPATIDALAMCAIDAVASLSANDVKSRVTTSVDWTNKAFDVQRRSRAAQTRRRRAAAVRHDRDDEIVPRRQVVE